MMRSNAVNPTADVDVSSLAETLLVVLCGVGFYIGFVGSYQRMATITDSFQQLLAGASRQPRPDRD